MIQFQNGFQVLKALLGLGSHVISFKFICFRIYWKLAGSEQERSCRTERRVRTDRFWQTSIHCHLSFIQSNFCFFSSTSIGIMIGGCFPQGIRKPPPDALHLCGGLSWLPSPVLKS